MSSVFNLVNKSRVPSGFSVNVVPAVVFIGHYSAVFINPEMVTSNQLAGVANTSKSHFHTVGVFCNEAPEIIGWFATSFALATQVFKAYSRFRFIGRINWRGFNILFWSKNHKLLLYNKTQNTCKEKTHTTLSDHMGLFVGDGKRKKEVAHLTSTATGCFKSTLYDYL